MSLEPIERHNPTVFEFLWCPVCGHETFCHIPFEGVFCERCNTSVDLREPIEVRGYAVALIACFDTGPTWNLHVEEKLRRDLHDGSGRAKILGAPGDFEVDWFGLEPGGECGNYMARMSVRNAANRAVFKSKRQTRFRFDA